MTYSLSGESRAIPAAPPRQRTALLLASVALHAAILVPIALNTVFLPDINDDRDFEVWLDLRPDRPEPVPVERVPEKQVRDPRNPTADQPQDVPETPPVPSVERVVEELQRINPDAPVQSLQQLAVELVEQRIQEVQDLQTPSLDRSVTDLNRNALPDVVAPVTRPTIEAIDGPSRPSEVTPLGRSNLPNVQTAPSQSTDTTDASDSALDVPVPRRPRLDEEAERALAAAAASGVLDGAWTVQPEGGGQASGQAGGQAGGGPDGNNTATRTGTIYFQGTPVDCTRPNLLSDVQRLFCDSANERRLRESMERAGRIQGTGDAERDAQLGAQGARRLYDYERRREPLRSGVGVSQGSRLGGSENGEILDEMSGTNREVQKLQDQMRASSAPRPPPREED